MRAIAFIISMLIITVASAFAQTPAVNVIRLPKGAYAPECAIDSWNHVHLLYATGEMRDATLHYVYEPDFREIGSGQTIATHAIVAGSVRIPQLAIGPLRCPFFGWMVSPKEFLCTNLAQTKHLNDPVNLIASHPGVDGGSALVFAPDNTLYAVWHAPEKPNDPSESSRKVFIARAKNGDYEHFDKIVSDPAPAGRGACACCALSAFATNDHLYVLYRCATDQVHRDIHLLTFDDDLNCIEDQTLNTMTANKCIMSTASFAQGKDNLYAAFESDTNIFIHRLHSPSVTNDGITKPIEGVGDRRKHPRLAINRDGTILLAWTEGTSFHTGGSVAWQFFSPDLQPLTEISHAPGLPAGSQPAAISKPDGSFVILY